MSARRPGAAFVGRPAAAEVWIAAPEEAPRPARPEPVNTARLTIDITPALRGRIKVAAFRRGLTMTDLVRELLARSFADDEGGAP